MSTMLYKHPGKHKLHGDMFDYIIIEEDKITDNINEGWSLTTKEAKEKGKKKHKPKVVIERKVTEEPKEATDVVD